MAYRPVGRQIIVRGMKLITSYEWVIEYLAALSKHQIVRVPRCVELQTVKGIKERPVRTGALFYDLGDVEMALRRISLRFFPARFHALRGTSYSVEFSACNRIRSLAR